VRHFAKRIVIDQTIISATTKQKIVHRKIAHSTNDYARKGETAKAFHVLTCVHVVYTTIEFGFKEVMMGWAVLGWCFWQN
jgi:hypothetical protein